MLPAHRLEGAGLTLGGRAFGGAAGHQESFDLVLSGHAERYCRPCAKEYNLKSLAFSTVPRV